MSIVRKDPVKALRAREAQQQAILQAVFQRRKREEQRRRQKRTPDKKIRILEKEVIDKPSRNAKRKVQQFRQKRELQQPSLIKMADQVAWDHAVANGGIYNPMTLDQPDIHRYNKQAKELLNARRRPGGQKKRSNPKRVKDAEGDWWTPLLSMGGKIASDIIPKLMMGMGDYTEEDPGILTSGEVPESNSFVAAATQGKLGAKTPNIHSDGSSIRVANREYLGDVYSSTNKFETVDFPINPGMHEWSPWGSPIANQYTNYTMYGAVAQFITEASDYTNVAGMGYVALGTQYNSLAPVFVDKREMLNSLFSDAVKPSLSMMHCIECDPKVVRDADLFVRAGDIPTDADLRLYDLGKLTLAVGGNTADGAILGELWISYDMILHIPKMTASSAVNNLFYYATGSGVSDAVPLGTSIVKSSRTTFSPTVIGNVIAFPTHIRGDFMVECFWKPTGLVNACAPPAPTAANCTILTISPNFPVRPGFSVSACESSGRRVVVQVKQDGASLTYATTGVVTSGATTVDVCIFQIPKLPAASPIFDVGGVNYDERYDDFMRQFRKVTDKFSDEGFYKERTDKSYDLMIREEDLCKGIGGSCYIKEVVTNTKTSVPFKVAPWLRTMSEPNFSKACSLISTLPTNSKDFVEEIIHICSVLNNTKDSRPKKYDNDYFDEKLKNGPTILDGKVKYAHPPNHNGNDHLFDRYLGYRGKPVEPSVDESESS